MVTDAGDEGNCFARSASVVPSGSGQEIPFSSALFTTLDTVFHEHGTDRAMFRSLNPRLLSLRISRYLVINLTLLKMNLRNNAHIFILVRSR